VACCSFPIPAVPVILQLIGIIAIKSIEKQGQSSIPADILVDNLIPNSLKK